MNSFIETGAWCIAISLLIFACFINWRKATVSFIFIQLLTWPLGIFAVEYGALMYPVRFFSKLMSTSFTYEFIALPAIGTIYCMYFPQEQRMLVKALYIVAFPTALTLAEVILLKYTDLIRYIHWSWYLSWLTIGITLHLNYLFFRWFFKKENAHNSGGIHN
ncbi:CBO0543 family protein [Paenibacillus sp. Soil766]|uniref:CBO0543 family protein n=1 Tax=Paenibacillus sp. Soil766 TaxID=1736404 RepID=UPI0007C7317A